MRLEPVTVNIGATVHDFDVHARHGDDVATTLDQWLHERGVLFFEPDESIAEDDFRALGSLFGEMYAYSYAPAEGRSDDGLVSIVGTKDDGRPARFGERTAATYWHTDGVPQEVPPLAALLTPLRLPSSGGDTLWASMTAAYEALSSHYQRMLDGLQALNSITAARRHFPFPEDHQVRFGHGESSVHPVVVTDPVTTRKALYVNCSHTERIIGMSDWESSRLLDLLFDHVNTPEFHVRLRWKPATIVVWDERMTQHRGVADYSEPRTLRRITIRGEPPR